MTFKWETTHTTTARLFTHTESPSDVSAATAADVIAAIEANAELREAVAKKLGGKPAYMCTECGRLGDDQQGGCPGDCEFVSMSESPNPVTALMMDRDSALSRLREAERERDEAKMMADVQREYAAIANRTNTRQQSTIAKLERELAEARAEARTLRNRISSDPTEADVLELRARRALDEWELANWDRRAFAIAKDGTVNTTDYSGVRNITTEAANHIELAKRLGLLGGEEVA